MGNYQFIKRYMSQTLPLENAGLVDPWAAFGYFPARNLVFGLAVTLAVFDQALKRNPKTLSVAAHCDEREGRQKV